MCFPKFALKGHNSRQSISVNKIPQTCGNRTTTVGLDHMETDGPGVILGAVGVVTAEPCFTK